MAIFDKDSELVKLVTNTRLIFGTLAVIGTSAIGAFSVASEIFLTRAEANSVYMKHISKLDSQTSYNKLFILGQRIDELVKKQGTIELSPEELRRLEDLRTDYKKVSEHLRVLENRHYSNEGK